MSSLTPDQIHPSLWRASQLARSHVACVESSFPALSAELPGGGWPRSCLIELLLQHHGSAELRLLHPVLSRLARQDGGSIVFIQPPYAPQLLALNAFGIPLSQCVWIRSKKQADALWAAEQVLRSGSCAALLLWQTQIRSEALRRLHLAAQGGEAVFFMMRPSTCADSPSPAPLRLQVAPTLEGVQIQFIKRRGIRREQPLFLTMPSFLLPNSASPSHSPVLSTGLINDTSLDSTALTSVAARNFSSELVN